MSASSPGRLADHSSIRRFEILTAGLGVWIMTGSFLDGWAHVNRPAGELLLSPWHAAIYSGLFAYAIVMAGMKRKLATAWAIERGANPYKLGQIGLLLMGVSGAADFTWHGIFGFEAGVDAAVSPPHLGLGLGAFFLFIVPLASGWNRIPPGKLSWSQSLPLVISAALLLSLISFLTQYAHPFTLPISAREFEPLTDPNPGFRKSLGVASILLQTVILMTILLVVLRRWSLPRGSIILILSTSGIGMSVLHEEFRLIPVGICSGVVAEALFEGIRRQLVAEKMWRVLAVTLPAAYYSFYFGLLAATGGVWWSVHLVAGSLVLAGATGLLVLTMLDLESRPLHSANGMPRDESLKLDGERIYIDGEPRTRIESIAVSESLPTRMLRR